MKDTKKKSSSYMGGGKIHMDDDKINRVKSYKAGGKTTVARGSGAARPQKFGRNG
jgi:hypothetical protein